MHKKKATQQHIYPTLNKSNVDLLFSHKKELSSKFSDIIGLHFIDHLSVFLLDPNNELTIISSTPSVEFNLINTGLWFYDHTFSPKTFTDGHLDTWETFYHPIYSKLLALEKKQAHRFTHGINLVRQINHHTVLYSFATRNEFGDPDKYYQEIKGDLLLIGNHSYNLIRNIFSMYALDHEPPTITNNPMITVRKPKLRLVTNNL